MMAYPVEPRMRLILAVTTLVAAFGCTRVEPSRNAEGVAVRRPMSDLVQEDAAAILDGMARARAVEQSRAGL